MNYEEKYKEALDRARDLMTNQNPPAFDKHLIEIVFPELKESEDERMKRQILDLVSIAGNGNQFEEIKDWLEKQKPTDKVEPKFKVGDWIIINGLVLKIQEVHDDLYVTTLQDGELRIFDTYILDNDAHLWTIQDAKDGDVLHSIGFHSDCIFIFDGLDNWKFDEPDGERAVATGYCCLTLSADNMEFGIQGPDCIEVDTVQPATKIQRDLLCQKIKEAGYEWDTEKKELKKIEAKTLDPDKVIAWMQSFDYDITTLMQSFKEHFGLN